MSPTLFLLAAALIAEPTKTTPAQILTTCYFNDAKVEATLLNHVVDVTSKVTSIDRDGLGGYVVRLDDALHTPDYIARVNVCCYFDAAARDALAGVARGRVITVRGVVRKISDDVTRFVDGNVQVSVKDCELVAAP